MRELSFQLSALIPDFELSFQLSALIPDFELSFQLSALILEFEFSFQLSSLSPGFYMKIIAIIPARGGSKGIPRKNLQSLAGLPLIAHTILSAKQVDLIDRVVVSTDDPEIAKTSEHSGAEIVMRPAEISGDSASSESAILHVLDHLNGAEGYRPDLFVFLQCTSPLTKAEDIEGTIQALIDEDADTALAVVPFHYFLWRKDDSGNSVGINHDKTKRLMRQEQEPQYLEAGAVYVMKADRFKKVGHRFFGKTAIYVMPIERCLEIDEWSDLLVAEVLMRDTDRLSAAEKLPDKIEGIVFDFDGVFTDNRVLVLENGSEAAACSRSDGWGLAELQRLNIPMIVISTEKNPIVAARCRKLKLECVHGVNDKLGELEQWAAKHGASLENIIYVGNDLNDFDCLRKVGCPIVVNDAHPDVKSCARIILEANGGRGAIRELADMIKKKIGKT